MPAIKLGSDKREEEIQTDLSMITNEPPVVYFLEQDENETEIKLPICFPPPCEKSTGIKSPKIPIRLQGMRLPVLIDTGAEVCVVPTVVMNQLVPNLEDQLNTRVVQTLGENLEILKGPLNLVVEVCGVRLTHPFYCHDRIKTLVMGIDLITAAGLIIHPRNGCVWSSFDAGLRIAQNPNSRQGKQTVIVERALPFVNDSSIAVQQELSASCDAVEFSKHLTANPPYTDATVQSNAEACVADAMSCEDLDAIIPDDAPEHLSCPSAGRSSSDAPLHPRPCASFPSYALASFSDSYGNVTPYQRGIPPEVTSFLEQENFNAPSASRLDIPNHAMPYEASTLPQVQADLMQNGTDLLSASSSESSVTEPKVIFDSNSTSPKTCELPEHVNVLYIKTLDENHLDTSVAQDLKELLWQHQDTFAKNSTDLGFCPVLKHDIDTGDSSPIKQSPRRPPLAAREAEDDILDEMLKSGVIEPSTSPWASPVCMVRKKDGTFRFCVDYRKVNAVSKRDAYPIPDIQDAFDHLQGSKYFATIDLLSGYWQIGMTDRAKERSSFCTKRGLFQFTRMPFGLSGAPSSFCRLMSIVLRDLLWVICLCYLDDIIIYAKTPEELIARLRQVLDRLRKVGLKVKPSKCVLFQKQIHFLGHQVSQFGVEPLPEKIEIIKNWPRPHCLRDVRAFFGLASYYRRFVKDFATLAEPLTRLTRKQIRFEWSDEEQKAFDALKQALIESTTLAFPHPNRPCILDTDASDVAIGAVLSQCINGAERPIAFYSRTMNATQRNYCATRRELLAVVAALQHFRHYLLGNQVILRTDHHSLKWLNTFKRPEGILARWLETLAEYDYVIEHRPGRLHSNVDGVSRPFCKQCMDKVANIPWVDELQRADELTELISIQVMSLAPEISDSEMIELQGEDGSLGQVIDWLQVDYKPTCDELRATSLEVRNLWSQRPLVDLQDGLLVRTPNHGQGLQLVVPSVIRRTLFQITHAGPLAAHLGSERTLLQMQQSYYWPGMRKDITQWCRECEDCAKSKGPPSRHKGKLQKVITGSPMDIVAVDILSGLPVTSDGKKNILVISDYFTKYSHAFALSDAEAPTCMRCMYNGFFALFGLPRQIHSDMGRNFESKLFQELCKLAGITKSRTTAFHPQSDGQVERLNRTILQMLRTTADDDPTNWPQRLDSIMAAYRMTVHRVTGMTPNMAMLGREVLFPATLIARPPEEPFNVSVPFVLDLRDNLRAAHFKVREATRSVAKTQKVYYDKHVKGPAFAVDQLVWLYWPKPPLRQKFRKLVKLWTGPWRIVAFKTSVVVVIQHLQRKTKQTVHVDRLLPCRAAVDVPPNQPDDAISQPEPASNDSMSDSVPQAEHQSSISVVPTVSTAPSAVSSRPQRRRRLPVALERYIVNY